MKKSPPTLTAWLWHETTDTPLPQTKISYELLDNLNNLLTINGSEGVLGATDANAVAIETNNAERLRVDASGNLGIEKMFER